MLSNPTLLAMLILSSFGLAGCDQLNSELAGIGRSMGVQTLVIGPGTVFSIGGENVRVFGYSICPDSELRLPWDDHPRAHRCAVIEADTVSVDVTYIPLNRPADGMPEQVSGAWSVKRDGDKVSLHTSRGDLVMAPMKDQLSAKD